MKADGKVIERLKVAISDYTRLHKAKPSFRTMQYQLIDEGIITDSESDHKSFSDATVKARLGWVDSNDELLYPKLDIDCFADDESRLVVGKYQDYPPTEPTDPGPIVDPEEYIGRSIRWLKSRIIAYDGVGTAGESGVPGGRWYGQEEYVEVWEEKNDLLPEFETILSDKHIKIRANKGYPGLTFLYKCFEELKQLIDRTGHEPNITLIGIFKRFSSASSSLFIAPSSKNEAMDTLFKNYYTKKQQQLLLSYMDIQ